MEQAMGEGKAFIHQLFSQSHIPGAGDSMTQNLLCVFFNQRSKF